MGGTGFVGVTVELQNPVAKVRKVKPKVFIFSPDNEEMIEAVSKSALDWSVEVFDSLSDLLARAARPLASQNTLLMVKISSEEAMRELCQFLAGSLDFDLILLLENEDSALAQAALAARPRMVFSRQPDPCTVSAVLEKMHPRMLQRAALLSA
jgi:hypothetical protein